MCNSFICAAIDGLCSWVAGRRAFGSDWPPHAYDWTDLLAQQESDVADKQRAQYEADRTWLRPSSVEIAHMEQSRRSAG